MLWSLIFEFYVKYIFGGTLANGDAFRGTLGTIFGNNGSQVADTAMRSNYVSVTGYSFSYGNYFSFIATFITIVIIVVLCWLFVYKIVKLIGGLIR